MVGERWVYPRCVVPYRRGKPGGSLTTHHSPLTTHHSPTHHLGLTESETALELKQELSAMEGWARYAERGKCMWYFNPDHPLRRLFAGITEQTFMTELGVADAQLVDYLSLLLSRFVHIDAMFALRSIQG